ncbi:uncharacterized protein LOC113286224 [Papaver somniferum]|nr:uncharacterized protein LOC113286224 [Papaver somniferum]
MECFGSPFLVKEWEMRHLTGGDPEEALPLDLFHNSSLSYHEAHVIISSFNRTHIRLNRTQTLEMLIGKGLVYICTWRRTFEEILDANREVETQRSCCVRCQDYGETLPVDMVLDSSLSFPDAHIIIFETASLVKDYNYYQEGNHAYHKEACKKALQTGDYHVNSFCRRQWNAVGGCVAETQQLKNDGSSVPYPRLIETATEEVEPDLNIRPDNRKGRSDFSVLEQCMLCFAVIMIMAGACLYYLKRRATPPSSKCRLFSRREDHQMYEVTYGNHKFDCTVTSDMNMVDYWLYYRTRLWEDLDNRHTNVYGVAVSWVDHPVRRLALLQISSHRGCLVVQLLRTPHDVPWSTLFSSRSLRFVHVNAGPGLPELQATYNLNIANLEDLRRLALLAGYPIPEIELPAGLGVLVRWVLQINFEESTDSNSNGHQILTEGQVAQAALEAYFAREVGLRFM